MAVLIQVRDAHKRFGDQVLLDAAELSLVDDVKVGFVGRNGAGKSTLLRVLLRNEELEKGEVIHHPSLRIGYLRQHDPFHEGESALEFLMRDSEAPEWRCGEVAAQFELKGPYLEGPVKELSGGWQTRVKLAALLLHDPNLLMLDEPTNFLDLRTQILLEHFLRGFNKAALIVSHDRDFLKATCTQTLELSRGKLTMFPGKIDAFLEYRNERREHDRRVNATVSAKQKQLQRFIEKNRANAATASQARSKAKQLEKLQTTEIEVDEPVVRNPRRESNREVARPSGAATFPSVIPTIPSPPTRHSKSNTANVSRSSVTTDKEKRRYCERWSIRSRRSPEPSNGDTVSTSEPTPNMSTQVWTNGKPFWSNWNTLPMPKRLVKICWPWRGHCCFVKKRFTRRSKFSAVASERVFVWPACFWVPPM